MWPCRYFAQELDCFQYPAVFLRPHPAQATHPTQVAPPTARRTPPMARASCSGEPSPTDPYRPLPAARDARRAARTRPRPRVAGTNCCSPLTASSSSRWPVWHPATRSRSTPTGSPPRAATVSVSRSSRRSGAATFPTWPTTRLDQARHAKPETLSERLPIERLPIECASIVMI